MKLRLKAILLFGLLALLVPLLLGYSSGLIGASHTNYVTSHAKTGLASTNGDCVACHTTLTENGRLTDYGNTPGAHRKHFLTVFLNFVDNYSSDPSSVTLSDSDNMGCRHCHAQTVYGGVGISNAWTGASGTNRGWGNDLEGDLSGNTTLTATAIPPIRKQVNPTICRDCHGQETTGTVTHNAYKAVNLGVLDNCMAAGTACHASSGAEPIAAAHNSGVIWGIDQRYANSGTFCSLCHGGQALFQQPEATNTAGSLWP